MIIVKLMGGLGNQMFQYAVGRSLAIKKNTQLKLDLAYLEGEQKGATKRNYELCHLKVNVPFASPAEVLAICGRPNNLKESFLFKFRKISGLSKFNPCYYRQKGNAYDASVMDLPENVYLDGYWQTEKYFTAIENELKNDFEVKYPLSGENLEMANKIKATNAVSLHFRRGDYVYDAKTQSHHGNCSIDYYLNAIDLISKKVASPSFYIFSDDMKWVQENVSIPFPTFFVNINGPDKGYEDLRLMSLCRHNIIANSSFSWWGAWLNRNPEKVVIAPEKWFADHNTDTSDLIPDGWIRI